MQKEYVAGFCFDYDRTVVVLILKEKPVWQVGLYNGVGGKIEDGETPYKAMVREFKEETDLTVDMWEHYVTLQGDEFKVYFFRSFIDYVELKTVRSVTEEQVKVVELENLDMIRTVPNLQWLIPMALSMDKDGATAFDVYERAFNETQV